MAQQASIIKLKGTIGGISFYKSKDGYLAREKGGVSASRIANDQAFARTRENGAEFGNAGSAAKLLRDGLRTLIANANDPTLTARATSLMAQVKNCDRSGVRGERSVANGVLTPEGMALLKGFNFNSRSLLNSVLFSPLVVNPSDRNFELPRILLSRDLKVPPNARYVKFFAAIAGFDFASGQSNLSYKEGWSTLYVRYENTMQWQPDDVTISKGVRLFIVGIQFFQSFSGKHYAINDSAYNPLSIVDVDVIEG